MNRSSKDLPSPVRHYLWIVTDHPNGYSVVKGLCDLEAGCGEITELVKCFPKDDGTPQYSLVTSSPWLGNMLHHIESLTRDPKLVFEVYDVEPARYRNSQLLCASVATMTNIGNGDASSLGLDQAKIDAAVKALH